MNASLGEFVKNQTFTTSIIEYKPNKKYDGPCWNADIEIAGVFSKDFRDVDPFTPPSVCLVFVLVGSSFVVGTGDDSQAAVFFVSVFEVDGAAYDSGCVFCSEIMSVLVPSNAFTTLRKLRKELRPKEIKFLVLW